MRVTNLNAIADDKTEVFFLLTPEAANSKTLFLEVGWIYAAVLSKTYFEDVEYFQYPYAYLGIQNGEPKWSMTGRPWCDFNKLICFTTLEEAIAFESQQELSCRRYSK